MSFIIIYVTHENKQEAQKISDYLLNRKLIACSNLIPIEACYWWQGKIDSSNEIVSILKTRTEHWDKVKSEIEKIHPYDVPCIIKIEVEANKVYEEWIREETNLYLTKP